MTTESTWVGIVGVGIVQLAMFAKILLTDKRKANESHVKSVETMQGMLRGDLEQMRLDFRDLQNRFFALQARYEICSTELAASLTRLELLEDFRTVAADDDPTGRTLKAMPPPPDFVTVENNEAKPVPTTTKIKPRHK